MNMIEKVARAICTAERYHQDSYELYIPAAKAAIVVMREPTEEMIEIGNDVIGDHGFNTHSLMVLNVMIDAALKED